MDTKIFISFSVAIREISVLSEELVSTLEPILRAQKSEDFLVGCKRGHIF